MLCESCPTPPANVCTNLQLFWELHTFCLHWGNFLGKNLVKPGGDPPPTGKIQNRNHCVFLSFGVDPLYWLSFIEIGEMACSRPAWCTHGLTLNSWSLLRIKLPPRRRFTSGMWTPTNSCVAKQIRTILDQRKTNWNKIITYFEPSSR